MMKVIDDRELLEVAGGNTQQAIREFVERVLRELAQHYFGPAESSGL
jgi:hypothetical protein